MLFITELCDDTGAKCIMKDFSCGINCSNYFVA